MERMFLVNGLCKMASKFEMPRKIILLFLMRWNQSRKFMIICNMLALFPFIMKAVTINEFLRIPTFHFWFYSCCFWGKIIHSCSVLLLMMFSTFLYLFVLPLFSLLSATCKCAQYMCMCVYVWARMWVSAYGHVCIGVSMYVGILSHCLSSHSLSLSPPILFDPLLFP